MDLEKLKYPIGKFEPKEDYSLAEVAHFIATIKAFPALLKTEVSNLSQEQLAATYRPNGWTVRQVVHHVADSHMNAIIRVKNALTENHPTIKPYAEAEVAKLKDYELPIAPSLLIIEAVHERWIAILESLKAEDFLRTYFHPGYQRSFNINGGLANYDWHCKHHLAHIKQALKSI